MTNRSAGSTPPPVSQIDHAFSRADLRAAGWSGGALTRAVRDGRLLRPRAGTYLPPTAPPDVIDACAVGGVLTCVSELARRGVFVLDAAALHVGIAGNASRLGRLSRPLRRHWRRGLRTPRGRICADLVEALVEAVHCQEPRGAIASLDSAWHLGLIDEEGIAKVFQRLPARFAILRRMLDPRAESGPESLMRLILVRLGCQVEAQVRIDGVGRVDFVVDGWLIIECDSRAHHEGWEAERRDRRRDQKAAQGGYTTYRPMAEDIMWHADEVVGAVRGLRTAFGINGRARVRTRLGLHN